jgi:hypothetical protein
VTITPEQLAVEGSLSIPLESIEDLGLNMSRLTVSLWIAVRDTGGRLTEYTFANQAVMPDAHEWYQAIPRARAALLPGDD